MYKLKGIALALAALFVPSLASAHEIYVLPKSAIEAGLAAVSPNPFSAYYGNEYQFYFWAFVTLVVVSTIFAATIFRVFERSTASFFRYIKRYALAFVRLGVGACFMFFAYNSALFGPEYPFEMLFGSGLLAEVAALMSLLFGIAILIGLFTRYIALGLIALWIYAATQVGITILDYADFLGAFILLFALGGGMWSVDHLLNIRGPFRNASTRLHPYAFPIMRTALGFGAMFAAVYAKYIHSALALEVVTRYDLTNYFPFDPLFVVLGALIIEFLAGAMLFFGVAIRWTGVFFIFWLTLSLLYFTEAVWPHLILFTLGLALFCHGYDKYSLEGMFFKRRHSEPVL
ncbi:MAG: hypothetical protein KBD06_03230 [Candidatus Pacebacteria bacterium]|nr:hypothetical protein [Candidatus Paceibacterota bacterium]